MAPVLLLHGGHRQTCLSLSEVADRLPSSPSSQVQVICWLGAEYSCYAPNKSCLHARLTSPVAPKRAE